MIHPDNRPIGLRTYMLCQDWNYTINGIGMTAQAGFINDGASFPRIVWTILGLHPDGACRAGAVEHDDGYRFGGHGVERELWDLNFKRDLEGWSE